MSVSPACIVHVAHQRDLFTAFAGFAIAIGCLGLIGLSAYTAERRTKEIGIRKVMGASAFDIAELLIFEFVGPVLLANALAWPVAWWFMRRWLETFAVAIDLDPIVFLVAGCSAVMIAVFCNRIADAGGAPGPCLRWLRSRGSGKGEQAAAGLSCCRRNVDDPERLAYSRGWRSDQEPLRSGVFDMQALAQFPTGVCVLTSVVETVFVGNDREFVQLPIAQSTACPV